MAPADSSRNILIVAGEASGDMHGAKLVRAICDIDTRITFRGIGGARMAAAGVDILFDCGRLAVVGISEVFTHLFQIVNAQRLARATMEQNRPDLVILIDYPDFNLFLAARAKTLGIPVVYYISPQVWAWRSGRVKKIMRVVDRMLVILPFEVDFYRQYKMEVDFVGHPLLDTVQPQIAEDVFCAHFGLDRNLPIVGLFPGSRGQEVKRLMPDILEAATILEKKIPGIQFVLPLAPAIEKTYIRSFLAGRSVDIKIIDEYAYETMRAAKCVVLASGTVTLEAAIMGCPMVIAYKVSGFSYLVAKTLVNVPYIGLANLVAGRKIVPELVQKEATGEAIAAEVYRILIDTEYTQGIKSALQEVRRNLGDTGASRHAAAIVHGMLA